MRNIINIILFIFTIIITGCGTNSRPADLPTLYSCTITVTQDGKPLEQAAVTFEPVDPAGVKYRAAAFTDVNGLVTMKTYGFSGVPTGKYKVVITKNVDDDFTYKLNESTGKDEPVSYKTYRTVEPKFSSAETTPLEIEISGKEKNVQKTFDVGKAIKESMPTNQ
ncbi:MAG: hypothetical protein LBU34_17670 [Planctomycetaceae bacterium]|jgi:hypothetical protein|nr:hypothetical protein [Planctomycetaceae bacterium]